MLLAFGAGGAHGDCFAEVQSAQLIFLVTASSKTSFKARLQIVERLPSGRWQAAAGSIPAVIGTGGIAWARVFSHYASDKGAIKTEGDRKTPAGFFKVKTAFGFASRKLPNYVKLESGKHFCVDDPRSEMYNTIIPLPLPSGKISGEDMGRIALYRRGFFIDYPTDRENKAGSCIFLHVWSSENKGTAGCVALSEADVEDLQNRAAGKETLLAILPIAEAHKLLECLQASGG